MRRGHLLAVVGVALAQLGAFAASASVDAPAHTGRELFFALNAFFLIGSGGMITLWGFVESGP